MCVSGFKCTASFCSAHSLVHYSWSGFWYCTLNILSRWETNEMTIVHSITRFSSLIPYSAGCHSGVILDAVKPGHMCQSEKADGGTIIGQGGIPKPALCWLRHRSLQVTFTQGSGLAFGHLRSRMTSVQPVRNTPQVKRVQHLEKLPFKPEAWQRQAATCTYIWAQQADIPWSLSSVLEFFQSENRKLNSFLDTLSLEPEKTKQKQTPKLTNKIKQTKKHWVLSPFPVHCCGLEVV